MSFHSFDTINVAAPCRNLQGLQPSSGRSLDRTADAENFCWHRATGRRTVRCEWLKTALASYGHACMVAASWHLRHARCLVILHHRRACCLLPYVLQIVRRTYKSELLAVIEFNTLRGGSSLDIEVASSARFRSNTIVTS